MKETDQKNVDTAAETAKETAEKTTPEPVKEPAATEKPKQKEKEKEKEPPKTDAEMLKGIAEKYDLTVMEKKLVYKVASLLTSKQTTSILPPQNIGDSIFKMYSTDPEPTEFLVDRVEFDDYGWNLVSYEKFGTTEMEFIFSKKDYKKVFFDTAEEAIAYCKHHNNK